MANVEEAITIKNINKIIVDELDGFIGKFLLTYNNREDDEMTTAEGKLADNLIKKIDSILDLTELLSPGISDLELQCEDGKRLGYIRTIFSKVREVWSIINSGSINENLYEFVRDLIRIKTLIIAQTNSNKWDWAYLNNLKEQKNKKIRQKSAVK